MRQMNIAQETPLISAAKKVKLASSSAASSPTDPKSEAGTDSINDTETAGSPDPAIELWCVCKKPDDGSYMVGCDRGDKCKVQWWHPKCAKDYIARRGYGLPPPENEADARRAHFSTWICPSCVERQIRRQSSTEKKRRRG